MSWSAYNDVIDAIQDREGLDRDDAREYYTELRESGLELADIREMFHTDEDWGESDETEFDDDEPDDTERDGGGGIEDTEYDDLDDWIDDYYDGYFDDYDVIEYEAAVDS